MSHPPQPGLRGRPGTASAFPALLALPLAVCRQYRRPSSSSCRAVLTRSSGGIASSRATRSSFSSAPILGLPKARSNSEFAATAITRRSASGRSETPPARAMYRGVRGVDTMPGCAGFGARDPAIRSCRDRRAALTAAVKKERRLEEPPSSALTTRTRLGERHVTRHIAGRGDRRWGQASPSARPRKAASPSEQAIRRQAPILVRPRPPFWGPYPPALVRI